VPEYKSKAESSPAEIKREAAQCVNDCFRIKTEGNVSVIFMTFVGAFAAGGRVDHSLLAAVTTGAALLHATSVDCQDQCKVLLETTKP
jgi:hypothetical protein